MADACCFMHKQQQLVVTAVYASAPSCNCQGFMHVYAGIACHVMSDTLYGANATSCGAGASSHVC